MKYNTSPTRGMKDYLPAEVEKRDKVLNIITETYRSFGFNRIETPVVEHLALLSGGEGGENEKLIFKILKRGDKLKLDSGDQSGLSESALRYDLTVPLSRFYANNQAKLPSPFKVIQTGSVWRAERPQKGRYRQFMQCDIDIIGDDSIFAELDLISASASALVKLGFKDFKFRINDRKILEAVARMCGFKEEDFGNVFIVIDKLDKIGIQGIEKDLIKYGYDSEAIKKIVEFLNKFQNKEITIENISEVLAGNIAPEIIENLNFLVTAISQKTDNNFVIEFDPTIVRGMGYYTGTIYEIEYKDYPGSIGGGGRYDKMVGKLVGRDTSSVGISLGFERLMNILDDEKREVGRTKAKLAILFDKKTEEIVEIYARAAELREKGFEVSVIKKGRKLGKQLKNLKDFGFTNYLVYGDEMINAMK